MMFMLAGVVTAQPPKSADEAQRRVAELEKRVEALLKQVQAMRNEDGARNRGPEIQVYSLKYAKASGLAKILKELLQGPDSRNLAISCDDRTNSVLVRATNNN